jgi:ABC-type lipoprotein release transport system permease subunit
MGSMSAPWLRIRSQLRSRLGAWLALALLIGVAASTVLATAAGARRTASAYPRFLVSSHAADLLISPNDTGYPNFDRALAKLPGAAAVAPVIGFGAARLADLHTPILIQDAADGQFGTTIERPKLLHGRLPRPDARNEVLADVTAARSFHLTAGSTLTVAIANTQEELPDPKHDPTLTLRVVGIGVSRDSVVSTNALAVQPTLLAGPALARQLGPRFYAFDGTEVALAPGTSKAAFVANAQALARRFPETGGAVFSADEAQQAAAVQHAIRPQAVALGLFAALVGVTALIAIGLVLTRQVQLAAADNPTLATLGFSRGQMTAIVLAQAGLAAIAGAVIAVVAAVAVSPVMPIGPARLAEPHPGVAFDWTVLGFGALAIVVFTLAAAVWPAIRATRLRRGGARTSYLRPTLGDRALRAGVRPPVAIGVQHATESGRASSAVPARSALFGVAVAIAAVAAAGTFGVNLAALVRTPSRYGQTWDLSADAQFSGIPTKNIDALLRKEPGVTAWTFGEHGDIVVDGQPVAAVGLTAAHGPLLAPTVVAGRAASAPGEIALGSKTLARIRRPIGATASVDLVGIAPGTTKRVPMHVVGRSVFPFFGRGSFTPTGLGVGAQLAENSPGALNPGQPPAANFVLIGIAPGSAHARDVARVQHDLVGTDLCGLDNQCTVTLTDRPDDIVNYARVRATPIALAAVLACLAVLVVASLLLTSIRRRRREFAVLRMLGFTRRQDVLVVTSQSVTLVAIALAIGLPVGIALGRWAWTVFARNLPVPGATTTPFGLLLAIPVAIVVAILLSIAPGALAARRSPARALRAQ